jgi:phosphate transport system substrate-binding protein
MSKLLYSIVFIALVLFNACSNPPSLDTESPTTGRIRVVVDDTFEPIIDAEIFIFEHTYPKAKITPVYVPENTALKLLLTDSIFTAVLSRELTTEEKKIYTSRKITVKTTRFAVDGVALIAHQSGADSAVTVQDILDIMQGKASNLKGLVFDNPNSSTVRYLKDLAKVKELPQKGVYALKSNQEVLRYVHANPGTIGVVGINWIEQPDEDLEQIVSQLKVLSVKNLPGKPGDDGYYKPTQNDLALGLYPLTRDLYVINGRGGAGLGMGFASFLAGEVGQRIVLKSGLLPDSIPPREVIIRK